MNVDAMKCGRLARVVALGSLVIGSTLPAVCVAASCFKVMDATAYEGKPEMGALGIQPIKLEDPRHWWHGVPDDPKSLKEATIKATGPLVGLKVPLLVDLELPVVGQSPDIAANRGRYIDVIHWMREAGLTAPLSYYSSLPVRDYWRAVKGPGSPEYRAWQAENDALRPIVPLVSALYPSLYTFYDDPQMWVKYALGNISEARRIGGALPVYPFVWPQYHNSNKRLGYQYIDGTFWSLQLRTLYAHADGLVLWGGWDFTNNRKAPWDEHAAWWQATKQFLANTHNLCPVSTR